MLWKKIFTDIQKFISISKISTDSKSNNNQLFNVSKSRSTSGKVIDSLQTQIDTLILQCDAYQQMMHKDHNAKYALQQILS